MAVFITPDNPDGGLLSWFGQIAGTVLIGLAVFSVSVSSFKVVATGLFVWAVAWAVTPIERWDNYKRDHPNGAFPFWFASLIAGAVFMGIADFAIHGSGTNWATKAGFLAWALSFGIDGIVLLVLYSLSQFRRSRSAGRAANQPGPDREPPPPISLRLLFDAGFIFTGSLVAVFCIVVALFAPGESGIRWLHGGLFALAAGLVLDSMKVEGQAYERSGTRSPYPMLLAFAAFAIFMGFSLFRVTVGDISFYATGLFAWGIARTLYRIE